MKVTGYCRGGLFPAADAAGRQAAIDDNKTMIDEAAAIGADCLILIGGGLPKGSRDIKAARGMFADGMAAILPHARACEGPARDRAAAPDVCGGPRLHLAALGSARPVRCAGEGVGVAVDAYHLWWDPNLARADRARRRAHPRASHLRLAGADQGLLLDRGMMGDGVIDLPGIRRMVEAAGFHGHQEVEIFSAENWWKRPGDEVLRTCIERYNTVC